MERNNYRVLFVQNLIIFANANISNEKTCAKINVANNLKFFILKSEFYKVKRFLNFI